MATDLLGLANQKLASHKSESCIDLSLFGKALGVGQMDLQVDITFQVALACDSVQPGCNIMQRAEWKPVIIILLKFAVISQTLFPMCFVRLMTYPFVPATSLTMVTVLAKKFIAVCA